ncbi:DEAD/DEAH box helicase [Alteribacillus sp. HJP-4]|uniref:DEAD/DEAH box helicase n=1 Tax=Alteribacillus sp. HJP-4 TaxID=2775394 RepID=UPI0035CD11D5
MEPTIEFLSDWESDSNETGRTFSSICSWKQFKLAFKTEQWTTTPSFDGLACQRYLPQLELFDHQKKAVKQVLEEMDGKAILADEVGLGKTIEAGLILKEYMIRGLVKKALILVPASLTGQWAAELNQKFYIPAVTQRKSYVWEKADIVVGSIDTAKRAPHREIVLNQEYDMIIIDEAHRLKNANTKNYAFVKELKKKFCLMLTATPVQNHPAELYHLINLLKPGMFGSPAQFKALFDKEDHESVRHIVKKVMVRNRREETGIKWTKRKIHSNFIPFTPEERSFYDTLQSLFLINNSASGGFLKTTLLREACSSKEAVFMTVKRLHERGDISDESFQNLLALMQNIEKNSKADRALEIIQSTEDKVVLFTEYRATQLYLQWYFKQHGIISVPFRGGFKRGKKEWMQQLFRDRAKVLIATEAGGEGINLQFSSTIINFDLPWNPMRLEQRIGRLHRLGQKNDVNIFHFAVKNTVDEQILTLLYEKIEMFENVIGEMEAILSKTSFVDFEGYMADAVLHSDSLQETEIKLNHLYELAKQGKQVNSQ